MKKKKVLIHSNHCKAFTGFGKHTKNILIHLQKTGKYDIVEFANGIRWGDPSLANFPWTCEGSLPADVATLQKLQKDPQLARSAGYGGEMIDKIIEREKPDIYIGIEDIWAFSGYTEKTWWNKINSMIWTTLDSLPILPDAVKAAPKIKNYYTWASFAQKSLNESGQEHVKTLRGALDTSNFYKLTNEQRSQLRQKQGINKDDFIIGFVFRNQLRKSVPNLLEGFNVFCKQNPQSNAKLLLHTHWGEGWDITRLINEKKIDPSRILTTYYCTECKEYEIKPFSGENLNCRFCGAEKKQVTTSTKAGVDESQLNEIYNVMDAYCHPFTSGGQEIPIQEAKLTELVTLVTNYSCGEDCCVPEAESLALSWTEYREPGTQFIKASTDPKSIAYQLRKLYNMKPDKRSEMGKRARQFVIDNYSVEVVGKQLEQILDTMPEVEWDFDLEIEERDASYQPREIESDSEWIIDLYRNILKVEVNEMDDGHKHWMQRLRDDMDRESVLKYFRSVAEKENRANKKVDLSELLDKDDEGKRLLIVMPERIGDVYLATSLFPNIKKQYPEYNIYFATHPQYFEILDGNPYIHKCIPFQDSLANLPVMEGCGDHDGYFEIAFIPFLGTQRIINFSHNGKDKIQFDLCT
jgi:glycosyltransferase involved in cell wall biosynthesis